MSPPYAPHKRALDPSDINLRPKKHRLCRTGNTLGRPGNNNIATRPRPREMLIDLARPQEFYGLVEACMVRDQDGQPWLYRFIMAPAIIAFLVIDGATIYYYIQGSCGIFQCIHHLPTLNFIAVTLAVLGVKARA